MELEKIKRIIEEILNFPAGELSEYDHLTEDLCADSLEVFRIIAEIERAFEVEICPEDAAQIHSAADALRVLNSL